MIINKTSLSIILFLVLGMFSFGQNQNISNGTVFDGEPYLAVNPNDAQHMVVAWMGYIPFNYISIKTRVTFNGGDTWSEILPIPHVNPAYGSADPSIEFNSLGQVFLSFIDYNTVLDSGAVYVVRSDDGGLSWEDPVEVINAHSDPGKYPVDRPWMSIDRSGGNHDGHIYITTMPPKVFGLLPPPYHPYFIASTDGGASFNQWQYLDTINWLAGNFIPQPTPTNCVSADGVFYAVYPSYVFSQNMYGQFILASSADAGNSFSYHSVTTIEEAISDTLVKRGYLLRCDPADADHLVFFYLDLPYGDIDVFMTESFDRGANWTDAVRINDDPQENNRMQDLVWAGFDTDGDLAVAWRDRRNGADSTYTVSSEIWGTVRLKNTTAFSSNFRISDTLVAYDTILAYAGNDFMCIQLADDTLNAVWGDTRNGKLNIWFQRMSLEGILSSVHLISSEQFPEASVYPNPFSSEIAVKAIGINWIIIYDLSGKVVFRYTDNKKSLERAIDLDHLPNGIYLMHISTVNGMVTKKICKQQGVSR